MALAALLPLVDQHLAAVYAVAFGLAAGGVFFSPAASSVLPSIVDEDELVAANSGLWSAAVISQIALAPLAGALVAALGVAPAFWINAASFAASALVLVGLRLPGRPAGLAGAGRGGRRCPWHPRGLLPGRWVAAGGRCDRVRGTTAPNREREDSRVALRCACRNLTLTDVDA